MGLTASKAEADKWWDINSLYDYIDVYIDDALIAARDPNFIVQTLQEKHKLILNEIIHLPTILDATNFTK
jgi:hypothetical protein